MTPKTRLAPSARRVQKISEHIARDLANHIIDADLPEGTMLPNEKEMVETFGIGRGTMRESLRLLETRGVITIRSGPGGGPVVRRPRPEDLGEALTLLLQFEKASLVDIWEARRALEPMIAKLAAERVTPDALDEIVDSLDGMREALDDQAAYLGENARFHATIAKAAGSMVLEILNAVLRSVADGAALGVDYKRRTREAGMAELTLVSEALHRGDADAAEAAMREHLEQAKVYWERRFPDLLHRPVKWIQGPQARGIAGIPRP